MSKRLKKISFIVLPILLGVFLIWYSLSRLSETDLQSIRTSFNSANYWWVVLSLFFGLLSHLSRAYRWNFLLEPMGYKPKLANSFMSVMIAYLLNLFVPRSGEIARGASIHKYEAIPFDKAIGTIVAERVADVIMLLMIIGIAFFMQADFIAGYLFDGKEEGSMLLKMVLLIVFPLIGIVGYRIFKKSNNTFIRKVIAFIDGLLEGVQSVVHMKDKWKFIVHTFFIWGMYVLMFYVVTLALPETSNLSFAAIIVGFVLGSLSMALTNGGLGSYPLFIAEAFVLYHIDQNPALAFGWIMWTSQTLMVVVFGGVSFFLLPIYNKDK